MGKEGNPATTKRTMRSNSSIPSRTSLVTEKTTKVISSSISNDLLFTEESISLDDLIYSIPGRQTQMTEILQLIGPLNSPMIPLFLYGGASTGKTRVILQIFKHLNRPFVYSSCRSCHNSRALFESVLDQLLFHRRNSSNGYSNAKRCERASDFINLLKDTLIQVLDRLKEVPKKSGSKEPITQADGKMVYLIFDNVELIRHWDKNSNILSVLFKLYDILKLPEVGLIYISSASPDKYYTDKGCIEHIPVFFPDYTEDDLYQIFMKNQANPLLYSTFLKVVLKFFCKVTRRINELTIALEPLFQKYCEPLSDFGIVPDESMKRRLFDNIYPHIAPSSDEIFKVSSWSFGTYCDKALSRKRNRKSAGGEVSDELDFHMSVSAKYLLISAFLASRNPATLDAAIFDSTGGSHGKKSRKTSETALQTKENKAQEMLMKGPGNFSLERLLALFQCITSVEDDNFEGCFEDPLTLRGGDIGLISDVLLQLSTLHNANFIIKSGSCPLEGSTRYRSTVDEEMALKVARSINFPLSKHLYRR